MKHMQTRFLWTQELIGSGNSKHKAVKSADTHADLLAKVLPAKDIDRQMAGLNQGFRTGRAQAAKHVFK